MSHQQYISELNDITSTLSKLPQKVGLSHKFYVPGWVGFIQECIVKNNMNKLAKIPVYKGLGYFETGNRIAELVEKACEDRVNSTDNFVKESDNPDNLEILASASHALETWGNLYPEIAFWMNQKIDDRHVTSAYGIIQRNVKDSMSKIMDFPKESFSSKSSSSFGSEIKAMGNQIAAMLCNVLVLAAVLGAIGAIADMF